MVERTFVRALIAITLCVTLLAFVMTPIPVNASGSPELPAFALDQPGLYRLEVALAVFCGILLLVTPAFSGLARGRLPIEISSRGAKFAEESGQSSEIAMTAIEGLEQATDDLDEAMTEANLEIAGLKQASRRDETQPEVPSKP